MSSFGRFIDRLSLRSSEKRLQREVGASLSAGSHRCKASWGERANTAVWGVAGGGCGCGLSASDIISLHSENGGGLVFIVEQPEEEVGRRQ